MSPFRSTAALTYALSGFWHQYFQDIGDIDALFDGTESLTAQAYRNLMNAVLGRSVRDTPLYRAVNMQALEISDQDIRKTDVGWEIKHTLPLRYARYMQDRFLKPTRILDNVINFSLQATGIELQEDPRTIFSTAPRKNTEVLCSGVLQSATATAVNPGDSITLVDFPGETYEVLFSKRGSGPTDLVVLHPRHKLTARNDVRWRKVGGADTYTGSLLATSKVLRESFLVWLLDCHLEDYTLYNNYGHLLDAVGYSTEFPPRSGEQYRNFLHGVMRLLSYGPTQAHLEAGISAVLGLPLVRTDDETVVEVLSGNTGFRTEKNTYFVPTGTPLKQLSVGARLRAGEPITSAVTVMDEVSHPGWWYDVTIPETFLPRIAEPARKVDAAFVQNTVRPPADGPNPVGGLQLTVGGEDTRTSAYLAMQLGLKHSLFGVRLHSSVSPPLAVERVKKLLDLVRPAHRFPYVWVE